MWILPTEMWSKITLWLKQVIIRKQSLSSAKNENDRKFVLSFTYYEYDEIRISLNQFISIAILFSTIPINSEHGHSVAHTTFN